MRYVFAILIAVTAAAQSPAEFRKYCGELAAKNTEMGVKGKDNWLFLHKELRHFSVGRFWGADAQKTSTATKSTKRDPLPAIAAYKEKLAKEGIELIFLPIPLKCMIYPDKLYGAPKGRIDQFHVEFYKLLRAKGVNVLDPAPQLLEARKTAKHPLYCRDDSHFSVQGCIVIARMLSTYLATKPWCDGDKTRYKAETSEIEIKGDLYDVCHGKTGGPPRERLTIRKISGPLKSKKSPILLFGDSHTLVFDIGDEMLAKDAGLASQLAFELGMPIDVEGVFGSGATSSRINIYRRVKKEPELLKTKKVFIWCLSVREFTETSGGWSATVPLKPKM